MKELINSVRDIKVSLIGINAALWTIAAALVSIAVQSCMAGG